MDFKNMTDSSRLTDKLASKAQAIMDVANSGDGLAPEDYYISPSGFVPFLRDDKVAFIRLEGRGFAGAPIEIDLKMTVADSPDSAGVLVDAVRYARAAMNAKVGGYLAEISAWLTKAPVYPVGDMEAKRDAELWLPRLRQN